MAGIVMAEECKIFNALPPIDVGGGVKTSDYWSMQNFAHATIIATTGVVGNDCLLTVKESTSNAGAGATLIDFKYAQELDASGDVLGALAWVGGTGGIQTGTNNATIHVIEIDDSQLSDGSKFLNVVTDNAAACLLSVVVILSGSRFAGSENATAQS